MTINEHNILERYVRWKYIDHGRHLRINTILLLIWALLTALAFVAGAWLSYLTLDMLAAIALLSIGGTSLLIGFWFSIAVGGAEFGIMFRKMLDDNKKDKYKDK